MTTGEGQKQLTIRESLARRPTHNPSIQPEIQQPQQADAAQGEGEGGGLGLGRRGVNNRENLANNDEEEDLVLEP